jgi:RNA-directed DNA polymerase
VANFLEVPYGQLLFLLYKKTETEQYYSFQIRKKSGGLRTIQKPCKGIDIIQRKLKPFFDKTYRIKAPVHGFVRGKSIITNAAMHKRQRYVLNIDLKDFYGTVNFGRVRGLLMSKPFGMGPKAASVVAQALCFQNKLPQGACTSPVVSNLIAADLDRRLVKLSNRYHCKYTRYADDITFSTNKSSFPEPLAYYDGKNPITNGTVLGKILEDTVEEAGFKVNHKKVRLQIPYVRQEVTGLTVNEFPNVKRSFIRQIGSMTYAWKKYGLKAAEREYIRLYSKKPVEIPDDKNKGIYFKNVLYGKLAFLKMVRGNDDAIVSKLASRIAHLDSDPPKYVKGIMKRSELFDVFIGHASEDKKKIAEPIYLSCEKIGVKAFLDDKYLTWGDSLTEKINAALGKSRFFLAVISEASIEKSWPAKELNSAMAREISGEQKVLPLIVGESKKILRKLPLLSDKLFIEWDGDADSIAEKIKEMKK